MKHCIQYATVGSGFAAAFDTENLTDSQVRAKAHQTDARALVQRFNRCPVCEVWTTSGGKLRQNSDCPAVIAALRSLPPDEVKS